MLATAYATSPRVLLMDEPSSGMRPAEMARLVRAVRAVRSRGVALLLVDHNLQLVRLLAPTVTVLNAGRVIARGTPEEISADPLVIRTYLGAVAAAGSEAGR
jgi:ABC-type branched-subunit amino acid transport system ATPase component